MPASGAPVTEIFKKMDAGILMKVRNTDHHADSFQSHIMQDIVMGQPVIWYAVLGVIKEEGLPEKASSAQMRLILGFNSTTREIIYTDNFGEGHELKRMPFDKAWPITLAIFSIAPETEG